MDESRAMDVALGRQIRKALTDREWTQDRLSVAVGVKQATVSRHLSGQNPWEAGMLERYCAVLGLDSVKVYAAAKSEATRRYGARDVTPQPVGRVA